VKNVVKRRDPGSGVKQVQGRGTNGNEGDIHPGSNLKRVHLRLGSVHNLSNFSFLLKECEVIFAEVPANPDLNPGPGLGDKSLGVPGLHSLVYPDGGEAGGPGVSVEESGHQGARVRGGAEDNLIRGMTLTLASRLCRLANRWLNVAICTEISHKLLINANGPFMWNVHIIQLQTLNHHWLKCLNQALSL